MRRSMLIVSLGFLVAGCATATRPTFRPLQPADFMAVYPDLATFMRLQGDLPLRGRARPVLGHARVDVPVYGRVQSGGGGRRGPLRGRPARPVRIVLRRARGGVRALSTGSGSLAEPEVRVALLAPLSRSPNRH